MSGHHPFSELTKDFTPERRRRIDAMKRELLTEMPLHELRRARALTQRDLAEMLKVNQPAVSKLEQRADMYVSSLRSYIEAVGGRLKIVAEFPEGEVVITNFSKLGESLGHMWSMPTTEVDGAPASDSAHRIQAAEELLRFCTAERALSGPCIVWSMTGQS